MSEQYLGEIRIVPFNFAPRGWAACNGQLLPINQNQALFSLLGTTYGGDGRTTFALPDLRGRMPLHFNAQLPLGAQGGEAAHTLLASEMPSHRHALTASSNAPDEPAPGNDFWPTGNGALAYSSASDGSTLNSNTLGAAGGSQPHNNMAPFLVVNFVIATAGIFPTRA